MKKITLIIAFISGLVANSNIYLGIQASSPSEGISVKIDTSQKVAFQGIFDILGAERSLSFRGIYRFKNEQFYNFYGYGEVGFWNRDRAYYYKEDINTVGYGAGLGVEYDLRDLDAGFIPIFVSAEIGLHTFDNEDYYYNSNELDLGLGLHYKFGY